MRYSIKIFIYPVIVYFVAGYSSLDAQMITNGGFDGGSTDWNIGCNCNSSGNCIEINPETVYGGSNPGNPVAEIDGHNNSNSTNDDRILCQEVDCFIPGLLYSLNFLAARRSSTVTPDPVSIQVEIENGEVLSTNIDRSGPFNWIGESLVFQATQTSHLISFKPNFTGSFGMLIDNISITQEYSISIDPVGTFCDGDLPLQLTSSPPGGIWNGPEVNLTGTFDPTLTGPGFYELLYILDTPVGCPPQMENIIIEVTANLLAQITPIDPLCEDADPIQLIGNPAGGVWQGVGADGMFNPADFGVGIHQVLYQAPGDCQTTDQLEIKINPLTLPTVNMPNAICKNEQSILLNADPPNGNWGGIANESGLINLELYNPGLHPVTYQYTNEYGCKAFVELELEIVEAVSAGTSPGIIEVCNDNGSINLFEELTGASTGGSWHDLSINESPNFVNGILETAGLSPGVYTFEYKVNGVSPCPDDTEKIIIEIEDPITAGEPSDNIAFCEEEDITLNLYDLIQGYSIGGSWSATDPSNISIVDSSVSIGNLAAGNYGFNFLVTTPGVCPDDLVKANFTVHPNPIADAGFDQVLLCEIRSVDIGGSSSTSVHLNYQWSGNIENPNLAVTNASIGGPYTLIVTDTLSGCFDIDTMVIIDKGPPAFLFAHSEDISCYGFDDGIILVDSVSGGILPFSYTLDGEGIQSASHFDNLKPGIHILEIRDVNGCADSLRFVIDEPDELSVILDSNLSENETQIACGDSVQLIATVTGDYNNLSWSPFEEFDPCDISNLDPCLNPWLAPIQESTYQILVTNAIGCSAESSITISVDQAVNVFIPNVFMPDGYGVDSQFRIYTNGAVKRIQNLQIYSRWGELIFQAIDYEPNEQIGIWDGSFNGSNVNPGVFVYKAEILLKDGSIKLYVGDVTIIK